MKRGLHRLHHLPFFIAALLIQMGLGGCSYMSIPPHDNIAPKIAQGGASDASSYNCAIIKGKILSNQKKSPSTLVIAWRLAPDPPSFSESVQTDAQGGFTLYLPQGRYLLYAVADDNENSIFEDHEVCGVHGSPESFKSIDLREGDFKNDVAISIRSEYRHLLSLPALLPSDRIASSPARRTHNGQVIKIYSETFSPKNAQTGYWNPTAFMKVFGADIYLTEPYNPRKIPVLFIHGTEGTPHNWIYFYMRLDRSRYQMWHYYYPSGIRLPLAASLLADALSQLQHRYRFQKMAIVAHSVGGLTARSFLIQHAADGQADCVKALITLATPWSGFSMADASQVLTHKSIPVWRDLGTQSLFIRQTLSAGLPRHVRHYLLYGKNDALAADAALDDRAKAGAVKVLGFNCCHDSILSSRKVFATFDDILNREFPMTR